MKKTNPNELQDMLFTKFKRNISFKIFESYCVGMTTTGELC